MAAIDDKVAIICENEVLYFRPERILSEEKKKAEEETKDAVSDTVQLTRANF